MSTRTRHGFARTTAAALALAAIGPLSGCLPGDERPEPGSITVTVEPSELTQTPFVTSEGWTVTIERFVTAVGDVRLQGEKGRGDGSNETCNDYAETRYERLFDFTVAGIEKVGLVYGLGSCNVAVRLQPPSDDPIIGAGATEADAERMRLRASDDYATDERTTLLVDGSATREDQTMHFEWSFRRSFQLERCPDASGKALASLVQLKGGDAHTVAVEIRAEELFRRAPADISPLQFELFAQADEEGDGDGNVTLEELADIDAPTDEFLFEEDLEPADNMAALLYEQLFPRVLRVVGGAACDVELRGGLRGP